MSVRNAGATIREARLKAGLSQEKLSDGICSILSLSRIENGTAGVSPSTFQALMSRAGAPCEAFPTFANRKDFDCFYTLKRVRFYLDCWQLDEAYNELGKIEHMNFAENKYYYQEWLLLHCKLQFRSGCGVHSQIYQTLLDSLHISRPEIDFSDFRDLLLSLNEIELLTAVAQESLYLSDLDTCLEICMQVSSYLESSQISFSEKERLLAENSIVYTKYLIAINDFPSALKISNTFKNKMIANSVDAPLHELTFLIGLAHYYLNDTDNALLYFKTAFFSAHSIDSCYATICKNYLMSKLQFPIPKGLSSMTDIPLVVYNTKKAIDSSDFSDGTYEIFSPDVLTIGTLIQELRIEQNISQQTLCQGLCSKSKLSKIENGTLQPDIALAQTLLQRLGISDNIFTFYGNAHETSLQNLRQVLTKIPLSNTAEILCHTQEMLHLCSSKDTFYAQYASYRRACCISDNEESATALINTLCLTINNFDFNAICNYRLSWLELTILNNYCDTYCKVFASKGILFLYKLLDYLDCSSLDVLEKKRIIAVTINTLVQYLYSQKRFSELCELSTYFSSSTIKCSLYFSGIIFANYSQALGEMQHLNLCHTYAHYAYYNLLMTNSKKNAEILKKAIYNDFSIELL